MLVPSHSFSSLVQKTQNANSDGTSLLLESLKLRYKVPDLIHIEASHHRYRSRSESRLDSYFSSILWKESVEGPQPHNCFERMATSSPMKIAVHQISGKVTVLEVMPETTVRDAQLELAGR